MNHFHRSWYLSDAVVTSYRQKTSEGDFFLPSTVSLLDLASSMAAYKNLTNERENEYKHIATCFKTYNKLVETLYERIVLYNY